MVLNYGNELHKLCHKLALLVLCLSGCSSDQTIVKKVPEGISPHSQVAAPKKSVAKASPIKQFKKGKRSAKLKPINLMMAKKSLIGLSDFDVVERLGAPIFKRIETPAEIWHYRYMGCTINIFFFRENLKHRVKHVEFLHEQIWTEKSNLCFASILKNQTERVSQS